MGWQSHRKLAQNLMLCIRILFNTFFQKKSKHELKFQRSYQFNRIIQPLRHIIPFNDIEQRIYKIGAFVIVIKTPHSSDTVEKELHP